MTRAWLFAVLPYILAGCGPIRSTAFIIDAEVQIQAAKTAGAEKLAPYEWTAANLYIYKAREEVGTSDYGVAVDFAEKASRYANEARDKSLAITREEGPTGPTVTPSE